MNRIFTAMRAVMRRLESPPRWVEFLAIGILALLAAWPRLLFIHRLPAYIWSKDGSSYAYGAFHWLETGEWKIDGRRGPIYTMFLGYATRLWGSFDGVVYTQHLLGWAAVLFTIICTRLILGKRSAWIVYLCGYAFAMYGAGIFYGHLIRNDALLFCFAAFAMGAWALAIQYRSANWLALAGLMAGLMFLTKSVFLPFPAIVLLGVIYLFRKKPALAAIHGAAFLAAFILPFGLFHWHKQTATWVDKPQPQSGILLYGRTAQWTVLDGGIEQELKEVIRADIESYRQRDKLDNNIIVNRTAIPHLQLHLAAQGRTPVELNRICRQFAFEAIKAEPWKFLRQAMRDFGRMHIEFGTHNDVPSPNELKNAANLLAGLELQHPSLELPETLESLKKAQQPRYFARLVRLEKTAWLFQFFPTLLTSLCVLWLLWRSRSERRLLWLGHAAIWGFTMVLLSTVGRPMNRYLMPALPVMFWTMTACIAAIAQYLSDRAEAAESAVGNGRVDPEVIDEKLHATHAHLDRRDDQ